MKKNLVRAALVASLSMFFAGTAFVATPAQAASSDKDKDAKPAISKSISKQMSDAQKAFNAKDWPTAIAKLKEAQAVADLTDYDKYILNYYLGLALYNSGDKNGARPSFEAAALSDAAPPDERKNALHIALGLANDANDYPKVVQLGQVAEKANAVDGTIAMIMAIAYFNTNDYPNAIKYAQQSIAASTAAGKMPERSAYQVVVLCQNRQKDIPGETKTFEIMANNYGNADDWGHLIDLTLGTLNTSNQSVREIAALDVYRLRLLTGATSLAEDYMAMADAAQAVRSPGDAQQALNAGLAKGVITSAKAAPALNKANADARRDQPVLAQADAAAAKSASANEDMSVGEAYYGYGRYADAIRVAQRAIAKGGPRLAEARLLLGMAQSRSGDDTSAAQTFASVTGDPAMVRAAHLWSLYATRKYGKTAAATPAAPAAPAAN